MLLCIKNEKKMRTLETKELFYINIEDAMPNKIRFKPVDFVFMIGIGS